MDSPENPQRVIEKARTSGVSLFPYDAGYDCGLNGANPTNCHFSIFSSPENTAEWERGKLAGERMKKKEGR